MGKYLVFISMGFELVAGLLAAYFVGDLLEKKWPSDGLITAGTILLVLFAWLYRIVLLAKKTSEKK